MSHWIVQALQSSGAPLNRRLVQMLDEDPTHRTERRGCGFTQSTRFLSGFINTGRSCESAADLGVFEAVPAQKVEIAARCWLGAGHAEGWRRMARDDARGANDAFESIREVLHGMRDALGAVRPAAPTPGSRLIAELICGVIDGHAASPLDCPTLPPESQKPQIGSCSQAEEFFLEVAHGKIRRGGSVNLILDANHAPLMIEKMNLGESHSALSLQPLRLNEVLLPPGSLFALTHAVPDDAAARETVRRLPLARIASAWFLRLTTLSVAPEVRRETFSAQVEAQVRGNMVSPLTTTLDDLRAFASNAARAAA